MAERSRRSLTVSLCVLACAAAVVSLWPLAGDLRTDDKNRDGRPDIWRGYDRQGELATIAVDTNFDGRSDVHEYYRRGALVRRESDRDFNNRIDLVQDFDATTRQALRAVSDVDLDGVADLLVLFQGGQPIYSEWAHGPGPVAPTGPSAQASNVHRGTDHQLLPLGDPFRADLAVRATRLVSGFSDFVGLATSGGLPESRSDLASPFASSCRLLASAGSSPSSALVVPYSPRGPPITRLLG